MNENHSAILSIEHVSVVYETEAGLAPAVNDVTLELEPGKILGLVGESGCGKSTLAQAIMGLLPPNASLVEGRIAVQDCDLYTLSEPALRAFRWKNVSMVFQSALVTLNPVIPVGKQFEEIFTIHRPAMSRPEVLRRIEELLNLVRIHPQHLRNFAHELSGGMRQRVAIAMAIALDPALIIMDEPTTALDAVVQQEILDEIRRIQEIKRFAVVFISHDLRLVSYISSEIAIMYAGKIVEFGPAERFLSEARHHPYTQGLLDSIPHLEGERFSIHSVPGSPPDLVNPVSGCAFHPRCFAAYEACLAAAPQLKRVGSGQIACFDVERKQKEEAHG